MLLKPFNRLGLKPMGQDSNQARTHTVFSLRWYTWFQHLTKLRFFLIEERFQWETK